MRHLRAGRKLNVDTQHRVALRRNLARSLFLHGRVVTSLAKAKAVRPFVEKLVTRAKRAVGLKDSDRAAYVHQVRLLRADVPDRAVLAMLLGKIAPLCANRPGGYTRILRDAKNQLGDNAPRAIFEFVDRPAGDDEPPVDVEAEERPAKGGKKGSSGSTPAPRRGRKAGQEAAVAE